MYKGNRLHSKYGGVGSTCIGSDRSYYKQCTIDIKLLSKTDCSHKHTAHDTHKRFWMQSIITNEKKATRKLKAKAVREAMAVKTKDPNASKSGWPAYIFLANKERGKVRQESPGIGQRELY